MQDGVRIGRLFGIDLVLDWTWGIVLVLMSWNLTAVFRALHPTWTLGASAFLGVVATLALFGCIVVHELAHSLVARAFGLRVNRIRLMFFGGVSDLEREPKSARSELLVAMAGPVASILLGVFAVALTAAKVGRLDAPNVATLSPATTLLAWLGPVNLGLGLFNLVPGFPLDGGRVLRAIVWAVTGNLVSATKAAAFVGRGVGSLLVGAGIAALAGLHLPVFGDGAGRGLWLVLLGWFLSTAARTSYQGLLVEQALDRVRVADLMRHETWTVPAEIDVSTLAADWFLHSNAHAFPVVDESGHLAGVVSLGDLKKKAREEWPSTAVASIMAPRSILVTCKPDEPARAVLERLGQSRVHQLPVVDGDEVVGMVSQAEIARWLELRGDACVAPRSFTPRRNHGSNRMSSVS